MMIGCRCLVLVNLLIVQVKAQWVLDNRCSRGRKLEQWEPMDGSDLADSNALPSKTETQRPYQPHQQRRRRDYDRYEGSKRESFHQLYILRSRNPTDSQEEEDDVWYTNLRGHRRSSTTSRSTAAATTKATAKIRGLFQEDPSSFMMLLHWQQGNCWQGEWIQRKWCMQCEMGDDCVAGNKLWTQFCDNSIGQKFIWIPNLNLPDSGATNYGSLKMAHFDLCLERMTTNTYALQPCDSKSPYQVLAGWHPTFAFELHPIENLSKCINQHHHPREFEDIANTFCETAARFHTNLWKMYQNDNAGNEIARLRNPQCSRSSPCDMCQGDCDYDDECEGDLVCAQRSSDDWYLPVPGCQGIPNRGSDYCTTLEQLFSPRIPNNALRIREPECTPDNPCKNACEGDCDSDNGCFGTMKCFMRSGNIPAEEVPGCMSSEFTLPGDDFCYQPDETLSVSGQHDMLELRGVECSEDSPCFQCEGDCDQDRDCYGPLECFQREEENPSKDVPGCGGTGRDEVDYCYLPNGVSLPTLVPAELPANELVEEEQQQQQQIATAARESGGSSLQLSDHTRTCTEDAPCQLCEGDCDTDIDCAPPLVCFQRRWKDAMRQVPGCSGVGVAGGDYCIEQ